MPKLKQPVIKSKTPSLSEFLSTYDAVTLNSALNTFDGSLGWELLKAYASFTQRQYEIDALDKMPRKDEFQAAIYASGYAKACEDVAGFLEGLRKTVLGSSSAYEVPRPEE